MHLVQSTTNLVIQVPTHVSHLIMSNQTRLRRVIRVCICAGKAQRGIPSICSRRILSTQRRDLCFRRRARRLGRVIGIAHVSQLVTNTVGDDVWVQSLLLALIDQRVLRLESELCVRAPVESSLELDCWCAQAEVESCDGGFYQAGSDTFGWDGAAGASGAG